MSAKPDTPEEKPTKATNKEDRLVQLKSERREVRQQLRAAEQYETELRKSLAEILKAKQLAEHEAARVSQRARLDNTALAMKRTADRHVQRKKDLKERAERLRNMVRQQEVAVEELRVRFSELGDEITATKERKYLS